MNFGKYDNKLPFPMHTHAHKCPHCDKRLFTVREAKFCPNCGKGIGLEKEAIDKMRADFNAEEKRLEGLFKEDAIAEVGLLGHPKAEKTFELAWTYGHESGLHEVWAYLKQLTELVL